MALFIKYLSEIKKEHLNQVWGAAALSVHRLQEVILVS